jgi:hypothetical protein
LWQIAWMAAPPVAFVLHQATPMPNVHRKQGVPPA